MIRPKHFGYNTETASTNVFQKKVAAKDAEKIKLLAIKEFDHFVELLRQNDIHVIVVQDKNKPALPDAVFVNNWFFTLHDGRVVLCPLKALNRRLERRKDIFRMLEKKYNYKIKMHDLYALEKTNRFLE